MTAVISGCDTLTGWPTITVGGKKFLVVNDKAKHINITIVKTKRDVSLLQSMLTDTEVYRDKGLFVVIWPE